MPPTMRVTHFEGAPRIVRDNLSIYLELGTVILKFDFSADGLNKALKHIPRLPGARDDRVLKPSWAIGPARKAKPLPKVKIARKTKIARQAKDLNVDADLKEAADDAVNKLFNKGGKV